jgi:protein-tyrosine phosphatase
MVDIHTHILWGLDDGAQTFKQSLEMLHIAHDSGTTDIVATPHSNAEYTFAPERIAQCIAALRAAAQPIPNLHTGCDFHLSFENVDRALQAPAKYTVAQKQYLLVECPDYRVGPETETVLARLLDTGLIPVVTHPERNPVLQNDLPRLNAWVNLGCLLQLTAMSITGGFGGKARSSALQILGHGIAHFIASDAHDPVHRNPSLTGAFQSVARRHGSETAQTLFFTNPMNAIHGRPIPLPPATEPEVRRKWWCFWRSQNAYI